MNITIKELNIILDYIEKHRDKPQLRTPALSETLQSETGIREPSDAASVLAYFERGMWYMDQLNAVKNPTPVG